MILRLLLTLFIAWVIFRIYKRFKASDENNNLSNTREIDVVICNKCGLHIPISEAYKLENKYYCCRQHMPK